MIADIVHYKNFWDFFFVHFQLKVFGYVTKESSRRTYAWLKISSQNSLRTSTHVSKNHSSIETHPALHWNFLIVFFFVFSRHAATPMHTLLVSPSKALQLGSRANNVPAPCPLTRLRALSPRGQMRWHPYISIYIHTTSK